MSRDRIARGALWVSVAINALGVWVFQPPALGYPSALLPIAAPRFFAAQICFVIALFLTVYASLAAQRRLNRGLIVVGGVGKVGLFALTAAYAVVGDVPLGMAVNTTPDLVPSGVFLWWASAAAPTPLAADELIAAS